LSISELVQLSWLQLRWLKKDKCDIVLSGLGSEEIFAGYQRHKEALNINKECLHGLRMMYERDLYRDDVVTMNNNIIISFIYLA